MPTLVLTTPTNPGTASWTDSTLIPGAGITVQKGATVVPSVYTLTFAGAGAAVAAGPGPNEATVTVGGGGGGAVPGGPAASIQFNDGVGGFGGDGDFSWNGTSVIIQATAGTAGLVMEAAQGNPGILVQDTALTVSSNLRSGELVLDSSTEGATLSAVTVSLEFRYDTGVLQIPTIRAIDETTAPAPLDLSIGELRVNTAPGALGDVLTSQGPGVPPQWLPASGGGTPSAPFNSVQFNNAGAFGGDADFTWDNATKLLTLTGSGDAANVLQTSTGKTVFEASTAGDQIQFDPSLGEITIEVPSAGPTQAVYGVGQAIVAEYTDNTYTTLVQSVDMVPGTLSIYGNANNVIVAYDLNALQFFSLNPVTFELTIQDPNTGIDTAALSPTDFFINNGLQGVNLSAGSASVQDTAGTTNRLSLTVPAGLATITSNNGALAAQPLNLSIGPLQVNTNPGTSGQVLTSTGNATAPTWQTPAVNAINQLTGDVTAGPGTGSVAASVVRLQGRNLSAAAPALNQVIKWDGAQWAPAADGPSLTATQIAFGSGTNTITGTGNVTVTGGVGNEVITVNTGGLALTFGQGRVTSFGIGGGPGRDGFQLQMFSGNVIAMMSGLRLAPNTAIAAAPTQAQLRANALFYANGLASITLPVMTAADEGLRIEIAMDSTLTTQVLLAAPQPGSTRSMSAYGGSVWVWRQGLATWVCTSNV